MIMQIALPLGLLVMITMVLHCSPLAIPTSLIKDIK
jgi:hypothetical protein